MQTTYHWRSKLLLYSLLALLTLRGVPGHCDIAADYTTKLTEANRSYAQGKYDQALHQWKLLLTDFPQASYTDLAQLRVAQCAIADKQWDQAAQALATLRQQSPTGAYLAESTVLLFQTDLALNKLPEADALWNEVFTRWPQSTYVLQVATFFFQAAQIKAPATAEEKLRQLLAQGWTQAELLRVIYTPLIAAGRVTDARDVHERCQSLLRAAGAPEAQRAADEAAFSESLAQTPSRRCYRTSTTRLRRETCLPRGTG